jgi:hypothetical protein
MFKTVRNGPIFVPKQFPGVHTINIWMIDKNGFLASSETIEFLVEKPRAITEPVEVINDKIQGCSTSNSYGNSLLILLISLLTLAVFKKNI